AEVTCIDDTINDFHMIVRDRSGSYHVNVNHRICAAFVEIAKFSAERVGNGVESVISTSSLLAAMLLAPASLKRHRFCHPPVRFGRDAFSGRDTVCPIGLKTRTSPERIALASPTPVSGYA